MPFTAPKSDLLDETGSGGFKAPENELVSPKPTPQSLEPDYTTRLLQPTGQPSAFSSGLPSSVPLSENPDWSFTQATTKNPLGFAASIPSDVLAVGGDVIAAGLNLPVQAKRAVLGTPRIGVIKRDETGKEVLTTEEKPLPFKQGQPIYQPKGTVLQPEGNEFQRTVSGFTTPEQLPLVALGGTRFVESLLADKLLPEAALSKILQTPAVRALESKPTQALFLSQTAPGAVSAAQKLVDKNIPASERKSAATDLLVNSIISYGLAKGLIKSTPTPTEVQDASRIKSTEPVSELEVRPRMGEEASLRQQPKEPAQAREPVRQEPQQGTEVPQEKVAATPLTPEEQAIEQARLAESEQGVKTEPMSKVETTSKLPIPTLGEWEKVASVTAGGKPYFWNRTEQKGYGYKQSVVWDRPKGAWTIKINDQPTGKFFDSDVKAKQFVESETKIVDKRLTKKNKGPVPSRLAEAERGTSTEPKPLSQSHKPTETGKPRYESKRYISDYTGKEVGPEDFSGVKEWLIHAQNIAPSVWNDVKSLRGYLDDLKHDSKLGVADEHDFTAIKEVENRISSLKNKGLVPSEPAPTPTPVLPEGTLQKAGKATTLPAPTISVTPKTGKTQAPVESEPFQPDDQLIMHSPHTGEDVLVSYRGPLGKDKSVVWTGKSQMSIPTEWLRRQGEEYVERTSGSVTSIEKTQEQPVESKSNTKSYKGYIIEPTPNAVQVGYSTEKKLFGKGRKIGGFDVIQPDGYVRHFDTLKSSKSWIDDNVSELSLPQPASAVGRGAEKSAPASFLEIIGTKENIKVTVPKEATVIRVTPKDKTKGRRVYFVSDLNSGKVTAAGGEYSKVEAGTIGKDKKFKPVKGEVTVEDKTPQKFPAGPGAATIGTEEFPEPRMSDVHARVESIPEQNRPLGIVTPQSPLLSRIGQLLQKTMTNLKGLGGYSVAKTTAVNRLAGEAGARYAASKQAARPLAQVFSAQTLKGTGVDPVKFGAALVEDNLRSIRERFSGLATELRAEGKFDEADSAEQAADQVSTIIGSKGSPFKNTEEFFDYLNDPNFKKAVEQHKQQWQEVVEPQYREAQLLDPDIELATRGLQTGARVNLKVVFPDEPAVRPIKGTGFPSLTATFRRKSPFGIKAKGTGQTYEIYYPELIANTFERQLEIANKNKFDRLLVETGLAEIHKPGWHGTVGGEDAVPFPIKRGTRIITTKEGENIGIGQSANIYVKRSLASEYRGVSNIDAKFKIPLVTAFMNQLNKTALAGLTDFTVHSSNLATAIFNRPSSGKLFGDTLLSTFGRADVPVTFVRSIIKSFQDNSKQLSELAEIGALRGDYMGRGLIGWSGKVLKSFDTSVRLVLDDTWKRLADAGLVEKTETSRREYVNQVGQYNRRLQGPFMRFLRDTGFGPFVTAGRTFNALGVKMATLSPGAKATTPYAAAILRANVLSKWVGAAVFLGTLNYLLTKDKGGGVMGRPGTPIGKIDTGLNTKSGRPLLFPLFDVIGLGRGLRVTGIRGVVEAKRLGLTDSDAIDAAARDIINSWISPAAGPPVRFGTIAATGYSPAVNVGRTSPVAPPGESQVAVNVEQALKDANPLIASYFDYKSGKSTPEIMSRQLTRFTLTPGKPPEMVEKYPRIVNLAQTYEYADYIVGRARKLEPNKKREFIQKSLEPLDPEQRQMVMSALIRRKVIQSLNAGGTPW